MAGEQAAADDFSARVGDPSVVQRVFDEMPLMVVAMEGTEHRIVAATSAYREYAGRRHMIGMPVGDAFPELSGQRIWDIYDRVYKSGQPESLRNFRAQIELPESGERVELFVDFNVTPRFGAIGEVIGLLIDVVDNTEQVRERQAAQQRTADAELRYERARDVIDAIQRELLSTGVPVLPQMRLAASYLLADADTAAGGDWFDALTLPDGRVAMVVGDVVGHGISASATMGQLRILLHEYLANKIDIASALRAVDAAAAERIRGARAATVSVVIIDPDTGAIEYCTAGHPPPLVVSTGGNSRYLRATGAGPIGIGGAFTSASLGSDQLASDELVVLYTDGILERPGRDPAQSTVELAQAAADIAADRAMHREADSPAERVCTQTLELLTRVTGHNDDITLLVGQRVAPPAELDLRIAAVPESLSEIRRRFDQWLITARVADDDAHALRHAVVELATNAIEHAYIDSPEINDCSVSASLASSGCVHVRVSDRGRWRRPSPSADRGLGLQLSEALMDGLRIEHDGEGTTVAVSLRPRQPARLLTAVEAASSPSTRTELPPSSVHFEDRGTETNPNLEVRGAIDASTVAEFDRALRRAGVTGTRSLAVDLTDVTHLASAGVAALHQLVALHRANGTILRLYAPLGSPAETIMTMVRLDHDTRKDGRAASALPEE
jgi:serine phosphatase RsbU (regulator of sigma subunit)/anti-sigma regulatory factor (Ser/Thr protein kinase)/anti-anti-sigma regulatory factor